MFFGGALGTMRGDDVRRENSSSPIFRLSPPAIVVREHEQSPLCGIGCPERLRLASVVPCTFSGLVTVRTGGWDSSPRGAAVCSPG